MPLVHLDTLDQLDGIDLDENTIGILPVGAIEAHGPHLPITTDCDIAEGHLGALEPYLATGIDAVVLPIQRIGASREHAHLAGTQSLSVAELVGGWTDICSTFESAGGRRIVIVSSHGGNTAAVDTVILEARARLGLLAVGTAWLRFGRPEGLFSEQERKYGIHGGDIETSLMLHYWPEKVVMEKADDFATRLGDLEPEMEFLTAYGPHRFGWLSTDLNPEGVVGNARAASAEKGAVLADHILTRFCGLLDDVARFDLGWFDQQGTTR